MVRLVLKLPWRSSKHKKRKYSSCCVRRGSRRKLEGDDSSAEVIQLWQKDGGEDNDDDDYDDDDYDVDDEWDGDVRLFLCLSSVRLHHWSKYFRLGWSRRWNCDAARFPFSTKYWGEIFANTQGQIWYNVDEKSFHTHIKWKSTEKLIQGYVCDTRPIYCPFYLFRH